MIKTYQVTVVPTWTTRGRWACSVRAASVAVALKRGLAAFLSVYSAAPDSPFTISASEVE